MFAKNTIYFLAGQMIPFCLRMTAVVAFRQQSKTKLITLSTFANILEIFS